MPSKSHAQARHGTDRSVRPAVLRVFEARPGVPAGGRDECRSGPRPCPYVRCKWHLYLVLPENHRGRRWESSPYKTTLRAGWLETPPAPSCGLDIAERVADQGESLPAAELARAMGIKLAWFYVVLNTALAKMRAQGEVLREFDHPAVP